MTAHLMTELLTYAQQGAPEEVCGFAFGGSVEGRVEFYAAVTTPNGAADRRRAFEIDGAAFRHAYEMAARSKLVLGLWHSHPDSPPTPSKPDFALISQLVDIPFIIVGVQQPVLTVYECAELGRVREAHRQNFAPCHILTSR